VKSRRSLHIRLLAGLAVILSAAAVYSGYTAVQIRGLRQLQAETVDRNRIDSLLLLRIQNDLNALGLAMRDMLDAAEPYPLSAWESQFKRMRVDLEDAISREARYSPQTRTADQNRYLSGSMAQFADALDRIFQLARRDEAEARTLIRLSLQARQAALTTAVARLLVQNNEREEQVSAATAQIYARVERNLYLFLGAMLVVIAGTSAYLLHYNRRVLNEVTALAERRSELTQQLISMQENTFRSISRELHDEFGQILTAVGAMLQRAHRREDGPGAGWRSELREVHEIVQATLEKVRSLSQALHPVMLDEVGLESALGTYLPLFEKRTGITISFEKSGESRRVDGEVAVHVYRVLQETLNNVARHAHSEQAHVRFHQSPSSIVLEVEDRGIGFKGRKHDGMGLVSMRERAEMMHGGIEFLESKHGGALVRLTVPTVAEETHAAAD
jgi:signal transduction histidine kinase